jgi:hypothetical protein
LIADAGSLALGAEAIVGSVSAVLVDVELHDEEEEFTPNNVKSPAPDRPVKAFREESMARL